MRGIWVYELEAQIFDSVDMDDEIAFYGSLGEFEVTAKVVKALAENDSILIINN